jgi:putative NADH-flavin reductase
MDGARASSDLCSIGVFLCAASCEPQTQRSAIGLESNLMRLLVLGATGGTGIEIVRQALKHGHEVTAFVRSPERLGYLRDQIRVERGNPLNTDALTRVIPGHDAVLSAFGPRVPISKADEHLLRDFAHGLIPAMESASVKRLIVESAAFLFRDAVIPPAYLIGKLFFSGVVRDQSDMETIVMKSGLDWTIVRPPRLTGGSATGKVRIRYGHLPQFSFSIGRADVAWAFLRLLELQDSIRQVVGVSS